MSKTNRVFVESFGNKPDAAELKRDLIRELRKKDIDVVDSRSQANVVLAGDAEIYVRGYVSLYARAGTSPRHGNPVYGGYASAELRDTSGETLWSYLATIHDGSKGAIHDLSKEIVRHLAPALTGSNDKK